MLCLAGRALASLVLVLVMAPSATAQSRDAVTQEESWFRAQAREARTHVDGLQDELRRLQVGVKLAEVHFQPSPRADINVIDAMSSAFLLTGVHVWVDDAPAYGRDDESGALGLLREIHLLTGPLAAGDHVARVAIQLRGNGAVLPYMRAYRFELASSHKFTASPGRTTTVSVRTFERGDATTPYVHLPAVDWEG
jgi:hypothetical protein